MNTLRLFRRHFSARKGEIIVNKGGKGFFADGEESIRRYQKELGLQLKSRNYEKALEIAKQCANASMSHFGEDHPVYASSISNMALVFKRMGDLESSVEMYSRALRVYKKTGGDRTVSFATALTNLGFAYGEMAKSDKLKAMERMAIRDESYECFSDAYHIRREKLEPGHPDIAMSQIQLGTAAYHRNNKDSMAEIMLEEGIEILEQTVGDKHTFTATGKNNLGYVWKQKGKIEEAAALYKQVIAVRRDLLGIRHEETISAMHNLAEAYYAMNKTKLAKEIQEEILTVMNE